MLTALSSSGKEIGVCMDVFFGAGNNNLEEREQGDPFEFPSGARLSLVLDAEQERKIMTRPVIFVLVGLISSAALAQAPKKHLLIYRTEHDARLHCHHDAVVWADTRNHVLYLPTDEHYAHTHGGYACESQARSIGYRGPRAHA